MAQEITHSGKLQVIKGNLSLNRDRTAKFTMNGDGVSEGSKSIPTTAGGTAIPMGDIVTAGFAWMQNLDANNYLQIGVNPSGTFYPFIKLKPGEVWTGRLGTNAPYALANTAACRLEFHIVED